MSIISPAVVALVFLGIAVAIAKNRAGGVALLGVVVAAGSIYYRNHEPIRSDEDLVIDDTPNRIRMVGSLRAGKDCLGAFSYELIGGRPVPVRAEPGA